MRSKNKYKLYAKRYKALNLLKISGRFLQFKRPKWYGAQDFIRTNLKRRLTFYSRMYSEEQAIFMLRRRNRKYLKMLKQKRRGVYYKHRLRSPFLGYYARMRLRRQFLLPFSLPRIYLKNWRSSRLEYNYNNKLDFYRALLYYYGLQKPRIQIKRRSLVGALSSVWVMALFKPFTLLWYLRFYPSTFAVKNSLQAKSIYLNDKPLKKNCLLKRGDLLRCHLKGLFLGGNVRKEVFTRFFHLEGPLVLTDKYTREVVILKDISELDLDIIRNILPRDSDIKHVNV